MAVTIRAVAEGEGAALRDVRLRALRESPAAFTESAEEAEALPIAVYEERVAATLRGETLNLVAVDDDGAFVGLAAGIPWGGRIRVVSVWTDPQLRNRGFGARLVDQIASWAGSQRLECQTEVAPGNDAALRLYRRLGFDVTDEAPPEGCDVVLVRR